MFRCFALMIMFAAPAAAQDKAALCATSGEIVDAAVTARTAGASERAARMSVTKGLPADKANFKPAVEPIVEWVYTLDQAQLGDGVSKSYVTACLAQ